MPAALPSLVLQGLDAASGGASAVQLLTVASFRELGRAARFACTAMTLGHWYLVIPSMQVTHLQSIVEVAHRVDAGAGAWWSAPRSGSPWRRGRPESGDPSFHHYIFSVDGIFFWQRILFGLAGPAVLSYLTWETAKIRANAVGDRHPVRGLLHRRGGRGPRQVHCPRDPRAGVVKCKVCGLHRGPEPVQFQSTNRVRAGRQQRSADPEMCRRPLRAAVQSAIGRINLQSAI